LSLPPPPENGRALSRVVGTPAGGRRQRARSQDPDAAREIRRAEGQLYLHQARRDLKVGRAARLATTRREILRGAVAASRQPAPQTPARMQPAPTAVHRLGALFVSMIRGVYRALPSFP
jgi:hypothetical protein